MLTIVIVLVRLPNTRKKSYYLLSIIRFSYWVSNIRLAWCHLLNYLRGPYYIGPELTWTSSTPALIGVIPNTEHCTHDIGFLRLPKIFQAVKNKLNSMFSICSFLKDTDDLFFDRFLADRFYEFSVCFKI